MNLFFKISVLIEFKEVKGRKDSKSSFDLFFLKENLTPFKKAKVSTVVRMEVRHRHIMDTV